MSVNKWFARFGLNRRYSATSRYLASRRLLDAGRIDDEIPGHGRVRGSSSPHPTVHWLRVQSWLAAVILGMTGCMGLSAASLPFRVVNPDGQWKAMAVQKEVAPGILCELIFTRIGFGDRLLVLSAPIAGEGDDSLEAFAERIQGAFTAYQSKVLSDESTTRMGFNGRGLRMDLASDSDAMECELFVFVDEQVWWGVLHTKPKGAQIEAESAFRFLHKKVPVPADVVGMAPYRVRDNPISSFPIGFEVIRNPGSDRISSMVVNFVPAGSASELAGVREGDVIVAIDGRKSEDFAIGVGKDTELGRIFLNRKPGDQVRLELHRPGAEKTFTVRLRVPR